MLGNISMGLVWGWLLVLVSRHQHLSLTTFGKLLVATLAAGAEVRVFSGIVGLFAFVSATSVALLLHLGWMQELRRRLRAES